MAVFKVLRSGIAFASVMLLVAGAVYGQTAKKSTKTDDESAILARLAEIQDAASGLNPDKIFDFVLENDRGALIQNGQLYRTRDEAIQSTRQAFRRLAKIEYRFDQQHVTLLSSTVALAIGEGVTDVETTDGRKFSQRFCQTVVLQRNDGEWKVWHAHRSFPPAAASARSADN